MRTHSRLGLACFSSAVVLLALSGVSSSAGTSVAPSCVWGFPTFSNWDSPYGHSAVLKVSCSGGIVGCYGMVRSYLWLYDPISASWVLWGQNPRIDLEVYRPCGSSVNLGDYVANAGLPPKTRCCLEVQWWELFGDTYLYMGSGYNYFTTP